MHAVDFKKANEGKNQLKCAWKYLVQWMCRLLHLYFQKMHLDLNEDKKKRARIERRSEWKREMSIEHTTKVHAK